MRTVALLLAALLSGCAAPLNEERRPNIVILFADDLGYGDLSSYGHPNIRTPRIDAMAAEGVKLTSFYAAAPTCTPSRAALLTGRYAVRIAMRFQGPNSTDGLPAEEVTLAEALRESGYRTAIFGKWHLGSTPGYFPTEHGFDEYFGLLYSNDMMPPWVRTDRPLHLYRGAEPTDEYPVDQTTLTKRYTEEAVRFIREAGNDPFFLYLPHSMPHLPITASVSFAGSSAGGRYGDTVEEIDWSTGRILDALEETGVADDTFVVFTSDNGPWRNMPPRMHDNPAPLPLAVLRTDAGSTGPLRGAKATTWEGGQRVPCIIRWPRRIAGGQTSSGMAAAMDLFVTIQNAAGLHPSGVELDGRDLLPMLAFGAESPRDSFFYFRRSQLQAVREGRWKLRIARPADDWGSPELTAADAPVEKTLHDLTVDPYEKWNRAAEEPEIVASLRSRMIEFAERVGADLAFEPDSIEP